MVDGGLLGFWSIHTW